MTTPYQNFILYVIIIVLLGDDFANAGYSYTAGTHCVNSSGPGNSGIHRHWIFCIYIVLHIYVIHNDQLISCKMKYVNQY